MSANPVWLIDKFCTMPNHWSDWTSSLAMQFLNWVRYVSSARFQRSLSLYSVWYDGGLARERRPLWQGRRMAILSKAGSPHVGLVLIRPLAWHSGPCSLGLIQLSHNGLLVPQHQISGSGGGLGENVGCFTECPASFKSTRLLTCFPQALEAPSKHSAHEPCGTVTCVQWGFEVAGRGP